MNFPSKILFGGIIIFIILFLVSSINSTDTSKKEVLLSEEEHYWQEIIVNKGAAEAYQELLDDTASLDASEQHKLGHIFGSALYAQNPQTGLLVCGNYLSSGCIHEFMGKSISEKGINVVTSLNETCTSINDIGGCQHGIGHGLIGFLGYDKKSFSDAIAICESLPNANAFRGCQAGVFMEYNTRTMLSVTDEAVHRDIVDNDWYAPCTELTGQTKEGCALWRAQWWVELMHTDGLSVKEMVRRGFSLCEKDDADVRDFCFAGVGRAAAQGDPQGIAERSLAICENASRVRREQLICRAFSINVIASTLGLDAALEMCKDLKGGEYDYCLSFAQGAVQEEDISRHQPPTF